MYSSLTVFFDHVYDSIPRFHAWKEAWQNQDNNKAIVNDNGLVCEGESTTTMDPQGRRFVIVGSALGNIVLSEKVAGCKDGIVFCDMPEEYYFIFDLCRVLSAEQFRQVYDPTLKTTLVDRMKVLKSARQRPPKEHSEQP